MDLRTQAVALTSAKALVAADETPLIDPASGNPCMVHLFSPGSPEYAKATARRQNRTMDRIRRKGKSDMTPEQIASEAAEFLSDCTAGWDYVEQDGLTGRELSKAIYSNAEIGFIGEQVNQHLGEWGNFSKPAQAT